MFFSAVLALALRGLLMWENKRLDENYDDIGIGVGVGTEKDVHRDERIAIEDYGPDFRYVL